MQNLPADLDWKSFLPPASFKKCVRGETSKQKKKNLKAPRGRKLFLFIYHELQF